ncbi:glycosyltransferase [Prosthecobacter dejongeii]|uniref:MGT family glycosyltransferase n=1 Tax=Prosthecobacter dejongeii TaxID=48465 RepID=A0A7W7YIA4_9BACT|nr:nucleotide disphospho-sugar-binding domain-containing protein [Prosthecobacter dejongeii]MBB5036567.1 MGT family glycosyltransferase [Prosthecobacter dejongeii]
MKRILFFTIPEKGHLNPMIGPAVWLQRLGHEVRFHAAHDISAQLHAAGLQALEMQVPAAPPPDANRGAFFAEKVRDPTWLREWIQRLLVEEAPAQLPALEAAIQNFQPDLIVTDPMIYPAAIAANHAGIPWVALSNSLNPVLNDRITSDLLETVQALSPARQALFAAYGMNMEFRGCDMLSPQLTIAFTTPAFIGRSVPGVEMVGPSLPPTQRGDETEFPWELLATDRPKIFMSFGSQIYHQPSLFHKVIRATAGMRVQLVLSVNDLFGTSLLADLPPHVLAFRYAPQLKLLPHVQAFITHGGANSVMEALHFGVPLLISPVCNDQFHQAHFIRHSGVGLELNLESATVTETRDSLQRLLNDPSIQTHVKRVAESYAVDGAHRAAELITALL